MRARTYVMGAPIEVPVSHHAHGKASAILEIELLDGRTVQITANEDGDISLRGWGNIPAKIGNGNKLELYCRLMPEPQTTCPVCYGPLGECTCEHAASN